MKKRIVTLIIFGLLLTQYGLYAFEWPVKEKKISATFGQNVAGALNTGVNLYVNNASVFPIAEGEIIFTHEAARDYTSLPRGLGSFLVIFHTGGIQSIYGHLTEGSITDRDIVTLNTTLGTASGALYVQINDVEENIVLNPLREFSQGLTDTDKPVIDKVWLKSDGIASELINNQKMKSGSVEVLIETADIWKDNASYIRRCTPYQITLNQNGIESLNLVFHSIKERDNLIVLVDSNKSYDDIYENEWLIKLGKIELVEGINRLQFLVRDYAGDNGKNGNQALKEYMLTVSDQ